MRGKIESGRTIVFLKMIDAQVVTGWFLANSFLFICCCPELTDK